MCLYVYDHRHRPCLHKTSYNDSIQTTKQDFVKYPAANLQDQKSGMQILVIFVVTFVAVVSTATSDDLHRM